MHWGYDSRFVPAIFRLCAELFLLSHHFIFFLETTYIYEVFAENPSNMNSLLLIKIFIDTLKVQKPLIWKTNLPLRNILYQMIQEKCLGFLFFAVGYYTLFFFFNMPRQFYCVLTLKFQLIRKYLLHIAMYKLPDIAVIIYYLNSQRMELHKTMTFLLTTSFIPLTSSYKCVCIEHKHTHTHTHTYTQPPSGLQLDGWS